MPDDFSYACGSVQGLIRFSGLGFFNRSTGAFAYASWQTTVTNKDIMHRRPLSNTESVISMFLRY
jgi:hypothetical protein